MRIGAAIAVVASSTLRVASGVAAPPEPERMASSDDPSRKLLEATHRPPYLRLFGTAMAGDGLRFNNPYRLRRELGANGESLSTTAPYVDFAVAATGGDPDGLQHGILMAWSVALTGVPQYVATPSYVALYRAGQRWLFYGHAGLPVLLDPDVNVGAELGAGVGWFFTGALGLAGELLADGFYGAGTPEVKAAFYPVLSAQLGIVVDYEMLP
jgi:hypothetical protein